MGRDPSRGPRPGCAIRWRIRAPISIPNLTGTFNVMEGVRETQPAHFLAASTKLRIYGANIR